MRPPSPARFRLFVTPPPPLSCASLPIDSELAACYSWEARANSKKEKANLKLLEQRAKLKLLGAGRQWEGAVRVREKTGGPWESRWAGSCGVVEGNSGRPVGGGTGDIIPKVVGVALVLVPTFLTL